MLWPRGDGMGEHIAQPTMIDRPHEPIARWTGQRGADPLTRLPGIDAAIGRARTAGNDALYTRLLVKFRDSQAGFTAAITDEDGNTLAKRMHDLCGIAGTLGADVLSQAASQLEGALRDGDAPTRIATLMQVVVREHTRVVSGLTGLETRLQKP